MRRVLIVSPHFPPVNAADMQRTRLALPYLRDCGWEPTVLAVSPESVEGAVIDELLLRTYPEDIRVIRVTGLSPHFTRKFGIGSLWWRCGRALRAAGDQLLGREKFDLVFFSTTQFDAFTLGPRWLRRFGTPYVLDYQDPWVNDYYRDTQTRPPGGPLRFWVSQFNARRSEPKVLKLANGIVSVSSSYGVNLARRYAFFSVENMAIIPFGTSILDLEIARQHLPAKSLVAFNDGNLHHFYTGRCGDDMETALSILFRAFKRFLKTHPAEAQRHRFHFIGTDYAPPPLGKERVSPIAEREQVSDYVTEHCYRVPYFDSLHYLSTACSLMVVGSDDPSYSASKIFPFLVTNKPLLTILHRESPVVEILQKQGSKSSFTFLNSDDIDSIADKIHQEWFINKSYLIPNQCSHDFIKTHGAEAMTEKLAQVFDIASTVKPV